MNSVNVFIKGANSSPFLSSYFYYFQESLLSDSHLRSVENVLRTKMYKAGVLYGCKLYIGCILTH